MTAEAVAELLKRPLYLQGAGDLGTDAATLEHRLRDTLEIARVWKAVVLIDEGKESKGIPANIFAYTRLDAQPTSSLRLVPITRSPGMP